MSLPLPDDVAWRSFERMLLIRRFEEAVLRLSYEKQFVGRYHLYIGQEATGAAAMASLDGRDYLATTHRNHGHVIARGADPGAAMAEILGRATGLNGGRGGTIHLSDPSLGLISTSGIVGGCISCPTPARSRRRCGRCSGGPDRAIATEGLEGERRLRHDAVACRGERPTCH